jgi:predicted ArsR family transcriptional regulator
MAPRSAPSYRTLASISRITLLLHLQRRGTMTVGDLAEAAGLHTNTAREHLQRLVDDGFVTCQPETRATKGRPRMLYSAAAGIVEPGSVRAVKAAAAELRAAQVRRLLPLEVVEATPRQRQLDALDDHLDASGFDSDHDPDGIHVHLHDCPYSEMVKQHPEVCTVHYGLIKSLLEQTDGPIRADRMHPLAGPDTCTLDLLVRVLEPALAAVALPPVVIHAPSDY